VKPENDPNYENRLNDKIDELMKKGSDYYPFEHSNFREFLANMLESQIDKMADLCSTRDISGAGHELNRFALMYWEALATTEAEARLEEEYMSCDCGGNGCGKCNDKEHDDE
jgi:hypothetical protein